MPQMMALLLAADALYVTITTHRQDATVTVADPNGRNGKSDRVIAVRASTVRALIKLGYMEIRPDSPAKESKTNWLSRWGISKAGRGLLASPNYAELRRQGEDRIAAADRRNAYAQKVGEWNRRVYAARGVRNNVETKLLEAIRAANYLPAQTVGIAIGDLGAADAAYEQVLAEKPTEEGA
jgi:hypothetical protein